MYATHAHLHPHPRRTLAALVGAGLALLALLISAGTAGEISLGGGQPSASPATAPNAPVVQRTPAWVRDPLASPLAQLQGNGGSAGFATAR